MYEKPGCVTLLDMKILLRFLLVLAFACSFTACLFKEPVFTAGFSKADAALGGVWATEGENGDPRKVEFAVFAPLDDERYLLSHPAATKDALYYEARPLKVRERSLLQLRVLATFGEGIPKPDEARYTLAWLEKAEGAQSLRVRALGGDGIKDKSPAEVKKLLEDPASDWSKFFGEATTFRRLKDN